MNATILGLIARRIGANVLILLIVSVIVFAATLGLPGDFAEEILGQAATPEIAGGDAQGGRRSTCPHGGAIWPGSAGC